MLIFLIFFVKLVLVPLIVKFEFLDLKFFVKKLKSTKDPMFLTLFGNHVSLSKNLDSSLNSINHNDLYRSEIISKVFYLYYE